MLRLQKFLADRGVASRRKCEEYIAAGMVSVNGEVVTEMGVKVDPEKDEVEINGEMLSDKQKEFMYAMIYKPRGYETTMKESTEQRRTVAELLEIFPERLVPAGRLDKDSEGLLLCSNDGDLINRIMHPSFEHEKEYEVMVEGDVTEEILAQLCGGLKIKLNDGRIVKTKPCTVKKLRSNETKHERSLLSFVLNEGRNRQIRRMCEAVGLEVKRLKRVRVSHLKLGSLKPGMYKLMSKKELESYL